MEEKIEFISNNLTPKEVLTRFLTGWQQKNYAAMAEYSQITWKNTVKNVETILKIWHQDLDLISFEFDENSIFYPSGKCMCKIPLTIRYFFVDAMYTGKCIATLVQEQSSYTPSLNGSWGVNPISLLKRTIRREKSEK